MKKVIVLIGAGAIGMAIARRVGAGRHILLADINQNNLDTCSKILLDAGFECSTTIVDISNSVSIKELIQKALKIGDIIGLIHAAGVSPSQAITRNNLKSRLVWNSRNFGRIW
jgi:NAD(P)-dependent dehydrogenase (short-subunit alcohol dehydrogenase family)